MAPDDIEALKDEVQIQSSLKHKNIAQLYDYFEGEEVSYVVMEWCSGGELFDRIVKKLIYCEKDGRDTIKVLLEAIAYCHENGVMHRDLKPENLILVSNDNDIDFKLVDFGFATKKKICNIQLGTPGYVSPEILKNVSHDNKVDMWAIGVITYIILGGYPPFHDDNDKKLFHNIVKGKFEFHKEFWSTVSNEAKSFITALLQVDPKKRLSAADALKHDWVSQLCLGILEYI